MPTIQELKKNIQTEIQCLGPGTLHMVLGNSVEGACICEQENNSHLTNSVFHR